MCGETDLDTLLGGMEPVLNAGEFVFCSIEEERLAGLGIHPVCTFREAEGVTVILRREEAERCALASSFPSRMITLNVHSSLAAVGFLARIATKLAEHGISSNAVSAYYHDHVFVRSAEAPRAMQLLQELQQSSRRRS
jgi:hypothetical protein